MGPISEQKTTDKILQKIKTFASAAPRKTSVLRKIGSKVVLFLLCSSLDQNQYCSCTLIICWQSVLKAAVNISNIEVKAKAILWPTRLFFRPRNYVPKHLPPVYHHTTNTCIVITSLSRSAMDFFTLFCCFLIRRCTMSL